MCLMMPDSFLKTDEMKKLKDLYDGFRGPPERLFKGCFFLSGWTVTMTAFGTGNGSTRLHTKKIKEGNVCEVSKSKVQDS